MSSFFHKSQQTNAHIGGTYPTPSIDKKNKFQPQTRSAVKSSSKRADNTFNKSQVPSFTQNKQFENGNLMNSRKPRASAFQIYTPLEPEDDHSQNLQNPQIPRVAYTGSKLEFIGNHKTKYFCKKKIAKSLSKKSEPTEKNSETINGPKKGLVSEPMRKSSIHCQGTEALTARKQVGHHSLGMFKSTQIQPFLAQQFRKVLDGDDCQTCQTKPRYQADKVVMTKGQLEIISLKQKLSDVEKQKILQKLNWSESERMYNKQIYQMQTQISELKKQNSSLKKHQHEHNNHYVSNSLHKLQQMINQKQKVIHNLEEKNSKLTQTFARIQYVMNQPIMYYCDKNGLENHLRDLTQHFKIQDLDENINTQKHNQKSYQSIKKQQCIKMLMLKNEIIDKELNKFKQEQDKLKSIQKILEEHNQEIAKYSLQKSNHNHNHNNRLHAH